MYVLGMPKGPYRFRDVIMPIYDYECENGHVTEWIAKPDEIEMKCPECGCLAMRIITASGEYLGNQDADWIKSVVDVVDKDSKAPHVREFMQNPTRKNYQNWMKGEGLRPFEPGERPKKPPPFDERAHHENVWRKHRERKKIIVRR